MIIAIDYNDLSRILPLVHLLREDVELTQRLSKSVGLKLTWNEHTTEGQEQARVEYPTKALEFAYKGYKAISSSNATSRIRRPLNLGSESNGKINREHQILSTYWWLQGVSIRKKSLLQAWEGVRLVREEIN
jgi:hypothetical protein